MSVETAGDRAAFLADFGVSVAYTGVATPFNGIFDNGYTESRSFNDAPPIAGSSPQLIVRSSDLPPNAGEGDALTITDENGAVTNWLVLGSPQPDGLGMTLLMLEASF